MPKPRIIDLLKEKESSLLDKLKAWNEAKAFGDKKQASLDRAEKNLGRALSKEEAAEASFMEEVELWYKVDQARNVIAVHGTTIYIDHPDYPEEEEDEGDWEDDDED